MAETGTQQALHLEWLQDNSKAIEFIMRQLAGLPKPDSGVYKWLVAQAAVLIQDLQDREEAGGRNGTGPL